MTSQFDALLDFGDSTPSKNGTSNGADPFDPFGPSPSLESKGSSSNDLLGDFSFDSQISGGQSVNPLYELSMSTDTGTSNSQSVNPLYDFDQSGFSLSTKTQSPSANPLYDFMSGADTNGHSGDLIDTGVTMETTNAIDDDSLLSSIDAKLKEKSDVEDQAKENVDLLNGEGDTNNTGDLLNGHVEQADQNIVSLEAEKPKEEEDVTIEQLEKEK
ncbi:hypothetical protein FSP39_007732 [Pinctada imbricata]|uniref:Uncharacterized protein n=1 Tax=Pinctada imbricata TaxID=66713 RepID=A0AA89C128_PINIB|nr:hypothetical protein FSP39_007732 [Pinctada imbricata]